MFQWIKRLLGGGADNEESSTVPRADAGREWEWRRADEYEYEHYTDAVEDIEQLKRDGRHEDVIALLEWCIDYTEAEARADGPAANEPAPAYYRHLAIALRKEDRYDDEVAVHLISTR